jgi:protease-4
VRTDRPAAASPLALHAASTIAVVDLQGPITLSPGGGWSVGADRVVRRLRQLRRRPDVRAVLLRINSPGGSVAAVQEIHQQVAALRKSGKVVVASLGDVAASGGYYVAAGADKIVANPGTLTGSIGVILQLGNVEELFRKFGVRVETVKSGAFKDAGSPFRPLGDEERKLFQGVVSDAYDQFFRAVSEGRNIPPEKLRRLADGRIFTGAQAQKEGLVDELGGFDTAVDLAKKLAHIRAPNPPLLYPRAGWDRVMGLLDAAPESIWPVRWATTGRRVRFEYVWE